MTNEEVVIIKAEAAKEGVILTTEFIEWANDDMPYIVPVIEKMLNENSLANS